MKVHSILFSALLSVAAITSATAAFAGAADDAKWVAQCVADNKGEGQSSATVSSYCKCMVDLMPESTTASVSTWEKTHKAEDESCSKAAGWVGK